MKKLLLFLLVILFISCCDKTKILNNGLTKNANKITEFIIKIKYDSIKNAIKDTLAITERFYNNKDLIINSKRKMLFGNETESIEIDYKYNKFNKIDKEIVKTSTDSIISVVNYFYKDSLLYQTRSETKNKIFQFKLIGKHNYHLNRKLKEVHISKIYIDLETKDTINSSELLKYNKAGILIEQEINDSKNKLENRIIKYSYKCNKYLKEESEYNQNDSLISTIKYKYQFDEYGNWIKRNSIKNGKISLTNTRKIEYQ
jgi:hypothetical protein